MIAIDFYAISYSHALLQPSYENNECRRWRVGERLSNMERRHKLSVHLFVSVSCLAINYEKKTVWQYLLKIDLECSKAKTASTLYLY